MFLSALFSLSLKITVYFLVFTLSLYIPVFAVIFGVAFLTVTLTNKVEPLKISDPA